VSPGATSCIYSPLMRGVIVFGEVEGVSHSACRCPTLEDEIGGVAEVPMASQSWSVWSLCRYRIPRFSRSASISSGIRPFTRTAYIPRAYFAVGGEVSQTSPRIGFKGVRTCSLPPCHPAAVRVNHRDDTLEERCCAIGDSFWVALQLERRSIPSSGLQDRDQLT
jgi:hypothetical protein